MRILAAAGVLAATFALSAQALCARAEAAIVSVDASQKTAMVGGVVAVDLSFTAEAAGETLIAYQADLVWSGERLSPLRAEFDIAPGGNPLDPEGVAGPDDFAFFPFDGFGLLAGTVPAVTAQEVAAAAQPDSFVFARLFFRATAPGPAVIGLASAMGFGGIDLAALNPALAPAGIEIGIGPAGVVPLPGAALSMGAVLAFFGAGRLRAAR